MKLTAKISVDAKYVLVDVPVRYGDDYMPYDAPLRAVLMPHPAENFIDWLRKILKD